MNGIGQRREVANQQVLQPDNSVFSVQWTVLPPAAAQAAGAKFLLERYLEFVRKSTFGLIRPTCTPQTLEFRLFGLFSLLTFSPPQYSSEGRVEAVRLPIRGGALVQGGAWDLGSFSLYAEKTPEGIRVTSELAEFHPRLMGPVPLRAPRRFLYQFTQAAIHKRTTVMYLEALWREFTGEKVRVAVKEVRVREGRKI